MVDAESILLYHSGMETNMQFQMNEAMFQVLVDVEMNNGFTHEEAVDRAHAAVERQGWSVKSKELLTR